MSKTTNIPIPLQYWEGHKNFGDELSPYVVSKLTGKKVVYADKFEGLNRRIRKVIKTRSLFPNKEAAQKLIYLAIKNSTATWKRASPKWSAAMPQFALLFGERFTAALA